MKILSIDPGKTIGVALYDSVQRRVLRAYETQSALQVANEIVALLGRKAVDIVVIENFVGQGPRDVNVIHTLKVLGFLEGFATYLGVETTLQAPQVRKHALEEAGEMVGRGQHYTDAMAHALAFTNLNLDAAGRRKRKRAPLKRPKRGGIENGSFATTDGERSPSTP